MFGLVAAVETLKPAAIIVGLGFTNHNVFVPESKATFNEVHPRYTVGYGTRIPGLSFGRGVYYNSHNKMGVNFMWSYSPVRFLGGGLFLDMGVTTGYEHLSNMYWTPFFRTGVGVRYNINEGKFDSTEGVGLTAFMFPRGVDLTPALGMGINYKIDVRDKHIKKPKLTDAEKMIKEMNTWSW